MSLELFSQNNSRYERNKECKGTIFQESGANYKKP
jgi:hypothetical protein